VPVWNFVRRRVYQDSVTLMRLTHDMEAVAGVRRAAAMMGTPANRALLGQAGLLDAEGETAGPADLVIAVIADDAPAAEAARGAAEVALAARQAARAPGAVRPRTLASALRLQPDATLALISVPGVYAGAEARRALDAGLHVMLFSDNVPIETEIELKRLARERGRFLMGPDCGTALIAGAPLGFANAVPRGRIGLVAASGTGLQEVSCRLAAEGEGVSHAIGVGGRDLSDAVPDVRRQARASPGIWTQSAPTGPIYFDVSSQFLLMGIFNKMPSIQPALSPRALTCPSWTQRHSRCLNGSRAAITSPGNNFMICTAASCGRPCSKHCSASR